MDKFVNHYDKLEVTRYASDFVIKAAYKALCQTFHPDKFKRSKEEAERKMKLVNAAYAILSNPDKRAEHDREIDEHNAKTEHQSEKHQYHDFDEQTEQQYQRRRENPKTEEPTRNDTEETVKQQFNQDQDKFDISWGKVGINFIGMLLIAHMTYPNPAELKSPAALGFLLLRLLVPTMIALFTTSIFYVFRKKSERPLLKRSFIIATWVFLGLIVLGEHNSQTTQINKQEWSSTNPQTEHQANNAKDISDQAYSLYQQDRYSEALPLYESLAKQGDALGQYNLGYLYQNGQGIAQDSSQAAYWYQKSALQGYSVAQNRLARMYDNGDGIRQDFTQAIYWYQKAAQNGSSSAQVSMGWSYMNGLGNLPKDYKQAAYWNSLGVNNGDPEGANNLGWQYEHGLGVEQDLSKAAELYQYAINRGIERGVNKERIDEAKSRLANLANHGQSKKPSDKKTPASGASAASNLDDRFKRTVDSYKKGSSDAFRYIEYLAKQGYAPALAFLNSEKEKNKCIIKPVMTKADIQNCQN
jgi:DnaJ domain/Sel1 repeat